MASPALAVRPSRLGVRALVSGAARDASRIGARALPSVGVALAATGLTALALTVHLALANPGSWGPHALFDLGRALGWIALLLNAGFAASLLVCHAVLERVAPRLFRGRRMAFLLGGLPVLHVAWMLLHRLPMVQHLVWSPVFVTIEGVVQSGVIACVVVLGIATGLLVRPRPGIALAAATAAAVLVTATLHFNASEEVRFRTYSMERVQAAAASQLPPAPPVTAAANATDGPVIVIGLDGWGWDAMVPLLEAGLMPNTSALVQGGAVGYLDNGDDSFSPRIWATVFSGRGGEDHGIQDFVAVRLPSSGRVLENLVSQTPAIDTVYGIKQLLRRAPSLGLWEFVEIDSTDVGVKSIWNVAGDYDRNVVVANPLNTVPVQPVNGAMVVLTGMEPPDARTFYPPQLAADWTPRAKGWRWETGLAKETDLTLDLFRQYDIDLGVYYTKIVDVLLHKSWDFYAEDSRIQLQLPADLSDAAWERLVTENAGHRAFMGYAIFDEELGRFRRAHPDATFVLVSDHGWTFSGYQHYGSQDGILLVSGPRARAGARIEGARIEDVAPTVASLLGIPISEELPGRVLHEALVGELETGTVASYGAPAHADEDTHLVDAATLEMLADLGYVQ